MHLFHNPRILSNQMHEDLVCIHYFLQDLSINPNPFLQVFEMDLAFSLQHLEPILVCLSTFELHELFQFYHLLPIFELVSAQDLMHLDYPFELQFYFFLQAQLTFLPLLHCELKVFEHRHGYLFP